MRAPVMMLAREIWWRNYKYACLSLGTIPCYFLFYLNVHDRIHDANTLEALSVVWMMFSLFWGVAMFNYTETNPGKGWTGFPCRLFVLPVPTWVLVACPMFLGMASLALVCLAWLKLVLPAVLGSPGSGPSSISPLWLAGLLAVNLAWFQAIVWSLAGFRIMRIVVLTLAGLVGLLLDGLTFAFLAHRSEVVNHLVWERVLILAYAGLVSSAFLGAWFSVAWQRRGGGRGRGWLKAQLRALSERIIDALPRRKRAFSSPLAAQCWLEWRQGGVLLPVCVGCLLLLIAGPVSWLNQGAMTAGRTLFMLIMILSIPVVLAFAIGKGFAKPDFWSMDLALKPFLAVRPLTAGEMVVAKMKVAAFSTVITWLLLLVAIPLWWALWVNASTLKEICEWGIWDFLLPYYSPFARFAIAFLSVAAAMIVTWRLLVGSLWVGLAGSWRYVLSSAVVHGLVAIGLLAGWVYAKVHLPRVQFPTLIEWIGWTLAVVVIFKLWLAAFFWDKVSRQHLSSRSVVPWLLAWASGTACLVALAWLICPYVVWLRYLLVLVALLGCPLARLAIAPLSLARNRHR